jgi:hypothetical protein
MKKFTRTLFVVVFMLMTILITNVVWGQVSLTSTTNPYTQNFDTLSNSGTSNTWTDNSTITGWYSNCTVYIADIGTSTTGGLHSYGTTSSTERSLGALSSGSANPVYIGVRLTNNTGSTVPSFAVSYTGEQWRQTTNAQTLVFEYQVGATSLTTGTWTAITALDFTALKTGTAGALDGNTTGNYSNLSTTISVSVNNEQEIWFRWTKSSTTSPGLAIDDFSIKPNAPTVPTTQTSNIVFSSVTSSEMQIDWTSGNGSNRAVFVKEGSGTITNPTNGNTYTASNDWSLKGTQLESSGYYCVYNGTGTIVSLTNLSSSTTYYVQAFEYNGSGTTSSYLTTTTTNNPNSTTTLASNTPTKLVITSINGGNIVQVSPSTFSITVQAQDDAGTPQNVTNSTEINLSRTTGTGELSGTVTGTISSGTYSVTISDITYSKIETGVSITASTTSGNELKGGTSSIFTVYSRTPSNQPTNLVFSSVGVIGFQVGYTAATGTPDGYLVLRIQGSSYPTGSPVTGTTYSVGSTIGDGTVAYAGSNLGFTESSLSAGTQYSYSIFSYNGSGSTINYLTTSPLQNKQYTMFAEPTTQATNVTFSSVSGTGFTIGWTNGDGTNRLVLVKAGSAVDATPIDGNFYSSSTTFGNGTQIGSENYVVYNYTGSSVNVTGLTEGTTYYVAVFEYNGSSTASGAQNYLSTTSATGNQAPVSTKYYSLSSGDPAALTNWKTSRDGSGTSPADFTTPATFVIQNTHTMTTTAIWTFSSTGSILEIENGGKLQADYAITIASGATFKIDDGGTYKHNNTIAYGSSIFNGIENFSSGSNFEINKSNTNGPSGVTFGNLIINFASGQSETVNCSGGVTTINGSLTIQSTSTKEFRLSSNSAYTLTIGGNLNISNGTLNTSNGTNSGISFNINLGGSYNQTGGTFNHNNSSSLLNFYFTGTNKTFTQSAGTLTNTNINWNINSGASLTLNNNLPIASSRTLTVNGTLYCGSNIVSGAGAFTLSSGATFGIGSADGITSTSSTGNVQVTGTRTFDVGANYIYNESSAQVTGDGFPATVNNLTINNSAGVTLTSSSIINGTMSMISGAFSLSSGQTLSYGSSGTLNYNGISAQTTTDAEFPVTNGPASLVINNSNGVLLHSARIIAGILTLTNGILTTASPNLLTIDIAGTISGSSSSSYVCGPLAKNTNTTSKFTFQIGNISEYKPLGIIPTSTDATTFTAESFNTPYSNTTSLGTGIVAVSSLSYFELSRSGNANASVILSWYIHEGVTVPSELLVAHWDGSSSTWQNMGISSYTTTGESGTVTSNVVSSFSPFALGSSTSSNTLPVELASFNSSISERNVKLNWTTSKEINNSGFSILRSLNNDNNWINIGYIKGNGTKLTETNYSFEDRKLNSGKYKYRLKQTDNNGNYKYFDLSNIIEVGLPQKYNLSQNYPNPFNPTTKIDFDLPFDSRVRIVIYDMLGREVKTLVSGELKQAGYYTIDLNAVNLASGIYFYRMIANGQNKDFIFTKKMVVLK